MYNTNRRGHSQADKGSPGEARLQSIPSREGVGSAVPHIAGVGKRPTPTSGPGVKDAPEHPRSRNLGGQHTLGLFGLPGASRRQHAVSARSEAPAPQAQGKDSPAQEQEEAPVPATPGQGRLTQAVARAINSAPAAALALAPRKLSRSERIAALDAMPCHGSAAPVQRATLPAGAFQAPDQGLTLTLRQGQSLVFVRLSAQDQRPVAQVVAEWKADCASLIGGADPYGDCPAASLTDAMRLAQITSDERERFVPEDREEWGRPMSWGCTEIAMAIEG